MFFIFNYSQSYNVINENRLLLRRNFVKDILNEVLNEGRNFF